ncbi:MAG: aldo/keto reductase [Candidatus Wenzhouxiangella sp. M2_3B_020]
MTKAPLIDHPRMKMPALGFGTFQLDGETVLRMIPEVLDMGYRHVDTAQAYDNEADVGKALDEADVAREEVFVTTKVWVDRFEPDDLRASVSESLDRLRSDYVDLLLLHWPIFGDAGMGPTLEALMREREDGRAKHIGVSNFTIDHLEQAVGIAGDGVLATNQVEYHVYLGQDRLHEAMRRLGLALTAYMPLAKGEVADDPVLREVAEAHDKTAAQVALNWLIRQQGVAAIPATSNPDHARANLDVFDFALAGDELERIDGLTKDHRLCTPGELSPDWDD